jgi:putative tricarboxylic transport membrane protein
MRVSRWLLGAVALVVLAVSAGFAQQYPSRPIEFVVPFGAGGGSDVFARNIAKFLTEEKLIDVPFNIVNKPGGSGAVGYGYVAAQKGNPYVIATVSASYWTTPLVGNSPVSYKDFTPLAGLAFDPSLLVTRSESPYRTLADLVAAAKKAPGKIRVSSAAIAADDNVLNYQFERAAGIKLNVVPFNGSGPALMAALGGHVELTWSNPGEILAQVEAKKIRVLAVSVDKRLAKFADVPTFKEAGYPVEFPSLRGVSMPGNIPADNLKALWSSFKKLCDSKRWQSEYIEKNLLGPYCMDPAEFGKAIEAQNDLYRQVFTELGVMKKK